MINVILTIYVIGVVVTLLYSGYSTGRQFRKFAKANPTQPIQVNWQNICFEAIGWLGFWAARCGEFVEKRTEAQPNIQDVNKRMLELGKEPRVG
jgi:hypothetical protein